MQAGNAGNRQGNGNDRARVLVLPGRRRVNKSEVRWWIKTYEHTTQCEKGEECDFPKCEEMKNNVQHRKTCQVLRLQRRVCFNCVRFSGMLKSANELLEDQRQPLIVIETPAFQPLDNNPPGMQLMPGIRQRLARQFNQARAIDAEREIDDQRRIIYNNVIVVRPPNAAARREENEGQDEGHEQENEGQDEGHEQENEGQDEGDEQEDEGQNDQ